jgi:hypothetical protein
VERQLPFGVSDTYSSWGSVLAFLGIVQLLWLMIKQRAFLRFNVGLIGFRDDTLLARRFHLLDSFLGLLGPNLLTFIAPQPRLQMEFCDPGIVL